MTPPIDNPTLHAVLQYLVAFSAICSLVAPLLAKWPTAYAALHRFAGLSLDVIKVLGPPQSPPQKGLAPMVPPLPMLLMVLALCGCSGAVAPVPVGPVANIVDDVCVAAVPAQYQWLCALSGPAIDELYALLFPGSNVGAAKVSASDKRIALAKKLAEKK